MNILRNKVHYELSTIIMEFSLHNKLNSYLYITLVNKKIKICHFLLILFCYPLSRVKCHGYKCYNIKRICIPYTLVYQLINTNEYSHIWCQLIHLFQLINCSFLKKCVTLILFSLESFWQLSKNDGVYCSSKS